MGHCVWRGVFRSDEEGLRFWGTVGIIWEKLWGENDTVMLHTEMPYIVIHNRKKRNQWKTQWKIKQQKNGN